MVSRISCYNESTNFFAKLSLFRHLFLCTFIFVGKIRRFVNSCKIGETIWWILPSSSIKDASLKYSSWSMFGFFPLNQWGWLIIKNSLHFCDKTKETCPTRPDQNPVQVKITEQARLQENCKANYWDQCLELVVLNQKV